MITLIDFLDNTLLEKMPQGFVTETHSDKTHEQLSIHKKLVINNYVTIVTKGNTLESVSTGHISGDECLMQSPEELFELEQILHIIREHYSLTKIIKKLTGKIINKNYMERKKK